MINVRFKATRDRMVPERISRLRERAQMHRVAHTHKVQVQVQAGRITSAIVLQRRTEKRLRRQGMVNTIKAGSQACRWGSVT